MIGDEQWNELKEENYMKDVMYLSEDFLIDFSYDGFKRLKKPKIDISYDDYLEIQRNTGNDYRKAFAEAYFFGEGVLKFQGKIESVQSGKILFTWITVSCMKDDGSFFDGVEDHLWMDRQWFNRFYPSVGGCVGFTAEIYRYIRVNDDKLTIDFGLGNALNVCRIGKYDLPQCESYGMDLYGGSNNFSKDG